MRQFVAFERRFFIRNLQLRLWSASMRQSEEIDRYILRQAFFYIFPQKQYFRRL